VKSGPDVFADALVPRGESSPSRPVPWRPALRFPEIPRIRSIVWTAQCDASSLGRRVEDADRDCADGYRFAKWQGKPNSATVRKPL